MKMTMIGLNEKYKNFPTATNEYIINGKQYRVHSHFIGSKDINKVISEIALNRAIRETLAENAA